MRTAGYMRGCMQYAPTGLRLTSIKKEYYLRRRQGTCWGVYFRAPTGIRITSTDKNTTHANGWIHTGAYAFAFLLGCDQFLPIKNTTHVDSGVHAGAYAIRTYLGAINFYR